eukprot:m.23025 g.23025  ORF g.23025 m.23025 type:complete len:739 (+) comp7458_c0_seq1:185-2401(+)
MADNNDSDMGKIIVSQNLEVYDDTDDCWMEGCELAEIKEKAFVFVYTDDEGEHIMEVSLDSIRPQPSVDESKKGALSPGDKIECRDGYQWFLAEVISVKDDVFKVSYESDYPDGYVEFEDARPENGAATLGQMELAVYHHDIPEALQDACQDKRALEVLRSNSVPEFVAVIVNENADKISFYGSPESVEHAKIQAKWFFESARMRKNVANKQTTLESVKEGKPASSIKHGNNFQAEVRVKPRMIGFVIGKGGENIQKVQKMPGIVAIEHVAEGTFTVVGHSKKEVDAAVAMLDVCEKEVTCPENYVPMVIGKNGNQIKEIISESGVFKIQIEQDDSDRLQNKVLVCIGCRANVDRAVRLVEMKKHYIKQMRELEDQEKNITKELATLNIRIPGSYGDRGNGNRRDSGRGKSYSESRRIVTTQPARHAPTRTRSPIRGEELPSETEEKTSAVVDDEVYTSRNLGNAGPLGQEREKEQRHRNTRNKKPYTRDNTREPQQARSSETQKPRSQPRKQTETPQRQQEPQDKSTKPQERKQSPQKSQPRRQQNQKKPQQQRSAPNQDKGTNEQAKQREQTPTKATEGSNSENDKQQDNKPSSGGRGRGRNKRPKTRVVTNSEQPTTPANKEEAQTSTEKKPQKGRGRGTSRKSQPRAKVDNKEKIPQKNGNDAKGDAAPPPASASSSAPPPSDNNNKASNVSKTTPQPQRERKQRNKEGDKKTNTKEAAPPAEQKQTPVAETSS